MKTHFSKQRALSSKRMCGGYTLIEIIVVVSIVSLLAALLFTVFSRTRRTAYRANCVVQLQSIALALDAYRQEQRHFPAGLHELLDSNYIQDQAIMHCPLDPDPEGTYAPYYVLRSQRDPADLPILICPFHETDDRGVQAYVGRYITQLLTKPAVLTASRATTVKHPGKKPVAAPVGLQLHGADVIETGRNGAATIEFADGSSASLKRNSSLSLLQCFLERNSQSVLYTLLRQTSGEIKYVIHTGSKFDVTTPAATAGALGTKFTITVATNYDTTLVVTEGKVRFASERRVIPVRPGMPVTAKNHNPKVPK